jgi:cbb3-type cytochrome oxidase subunit 3
VPKLSTVVLAAIAGIAVLVIASVFGFILFLSGMGLSSQLWWMGFCALIFALVFFFAYASTDEKKVIRPLAGAFFVIGVGSYYGAIFTNGDSQLLKVVWLVILSIFTVLVLFWIFWASREGERDTIRRSQRKLTP